MTHAAASRIIAGALFLLLVLCHDRPAGAQSPPPPAAPVDLQGDPIPAGALLRFGTTRFRTILSCNLVMFAGDSAVLTVCPDKLVTLHAWPSGVRKLKVLAGEEPAKSFGMSPDGSRLVVAATNGRLSVLLVATGKWQIRFDPVKYVSNALAVSPDGAQVACAGEDGVIHVRALADGTESRVLGSPGPPLVAIAWAPGGRIGCLDREGRIRAWDAAAAKPSADFVAAAGSTRFALAPDGSRAWLCGGAPAASCWTLADGKPVLKLEADAEETRCLALSPDGTRVATGGRDGRVRVWEAASGKEAWSLPAHVGWVTDLSFSPDGKSIASVGEDRAVRAFDASKGTDLAPWPSHSGEVLCVALSPDGKTLATGSWDRSVQLWNVETSRSASRFANLPGAVAGLSWAPSGASIAVAAGKDLVVLDVADDAKRRTVGAGSGALRGVSWVGGDGGVLSGGTDTVVRHWNLKDPKPDRELRGHGSLVAAIASSPDGKRFVTGDSDGRSALWDFSTGTPTWLKDHPKAVTAVAFSADGLRVATGCADACVRIWEADSGKLAGTILGFDGQVTGVAFSPDGKMLAASAVGNSVRICQSPGGQEVALFHGMGGTVNGVCWLPDGKRIVTAMYDTTAIEWQVLK